jgi:hypothetical protein
VRCRGLCWIWSDRVPGAPADEAASAAFTDESGTVDFDAKAEPAALVDFPDELGKDFGAKPEATALVDFPDELEADFGAKAEPEALGASPLG